MSRPALPRVVVNVELIALDMVAKGWKTTDLIVAVQLVARQLAPVKPPHANSIYRFLRGSAQTPRIANLVARALEHPPERYLRIVDTGYVGKLPAEPEGVAR